MIANRVILRGRLVADPKTRQFEARGETVAFTSLWVEVKDGDRAERFSVDVRCPRLIETAKALRENVLVELTGVLRHDRWRGPDNKWTGKVYVALEPGQGALRSQGVGAEDADRAPQAA